MNCSTSTEEFLDSKEFAKHFLINSTNTEKNLDFLPEVPLCQIKVDNEFEEPTAGKVPIWQKKHVCNLLTLVKQNYESLCDKTSKKKIVWAHIASSLNQAQGTSFSCEQVHVKYRKLLERYKKYSGNILRANVAAKKPEFYEEMREIVGATPCTTLQFNKDVSKSANVPSTTTVGMRKILPRPEVTPGSLFHTGMPEASTHLSTTQLEFPLAAVVHLPAATPPHGSKETVSSGSLITHSNNTSTAILLPQVLSPFHNSAQSTTIASQASVPVTSVISVSSPRVCVQEDKNDKDAALHFLLSGPHDGIDHNEDAHNINESPELKSSRTPRRPRKSSSVSHSAFVRRYMERHLQEMEENRQHRQRVEAFLNSVTASLQELVRLVNYQCNR